MKKGVDYIGVGVGILLVNDKGQLFLSQRGPKARNERGKWEFPGGSVEFGETCEAAIKREMREEFNIDIEITDFLEVSDHIIPDEKQHWVSPTYVGKIVSGTPKIMEPEKISDIKWEGPEDINMEEISLVSISNLEAYKKKYNNSSF